MKLFPAKMLKPIAKGGTKVVRFVGKNSNWVLSVLAFLGLLGTAWSFTDATIKAVKLCEEKQVKGAKEIVKTVWKLYLPGIGFVVVTTFSIFGNAISNAKRIATATGLWMASKADLKAVKKKTAEILGDSKAQHIDQETERAKVAANPPPSEDEISKTGHGDKLFRFGWTGRYFRSSPEWIELIFERLNNELHDGYGDTILMHRLIELLDMPHCDSGDAYWSLVDMKKEGYSRINADICNCQWMEVNGRQEMVSTLRCNPPPTGF